MKKLVTNLLLCAALSLPMAGAKLARAEKHPTNACGCYGDSNSCFCEKKAKCGCPGECEPKGCEEQRQKQIEKEIEAETKRAKEDEKARTKVKEEAKAAEGEGAAATAEKDAKGAKTPAVRPMSASQKKQLLKLIEAYLAEYPEAENKMLSEVRTELK